MFVDEVDIHVTAGAGGRGCLSFRREKFVPRGGPDGGDGGPGGSVVMVASPRKRTLIDFRYQPKYEARRGRHGEGANRTGKAGQDLEVEVPAGTLIYAQDDEGTLHLIADLVSDGQRVVVARGGRGGRGNARFVSSTNRAPRRVDPGEPGEDRRLRLQLKLIADAGLIGFPNAGKSTLISRISAARPKIAPYPFTTLEPNLGVVSLTGDRDFVVADVPGLIEGAHAGRGLGDRFLRHIERTKVLVHLVDVSGASGRDPIEDFDAIQHELRLYGHGVDAKPQIVAATKMDALDDRARVDRLEAHVAPLGLPFHRISAVSGLGLDALVEEIWRTIAAAAAAEPPPVTDGDTEDGVDLLAGMPSRRA